MEQFTPLSGFIGGCLIGIAATALLYFHRKICGISGIFEGALPPYKEDATWKVLFVLGLFSGGVLLRFLYPFAFSFTIETSFPLVFGGGFLVGAGSRLGNGCTSGHGVCGIGRLSKRSVVATAIFFVTAVVVASIRGV